MKKWLRRVRGALGMGLIWAAGWALVGVLIGLSWSLGLPMEWFVEVFDAPLPALALEAKRASLMSTATAAIACYVARELSKRTHMFLIQVWNSSRVLFHAATARISASAASMPAESSKPLSMRRASEAAWPSLLFPSTKG